MTSTEPETTASSRTASVFRDHGPDKEKFAGTEKPTTTLKEDVAAAGLEAVFKRHGRVDLVPMPSDDPNDPYNWASWRKNVLLVQVAFHAMMGPFSAAAVIPAFEDFVGDYGISITQASYFVSVPIIFLGVFPLIWAPVASRVGRRPIYLISTLVSAGLHLASAYCHSYGTLMVTRVFQGIFLSPPASLGAQTVNEMFFQHEKGQKMGVWALLTSMGPPLAPFIMGFVVYNKNWPWLFNLLAIINLAQFFLYLFLGPETLFDRPERFPNGQQVASTPSPTQNTSKWAAYVRFERHGNVPWSQMPIEIVRPLSMLFKLPVLLATLAYAITFTYSNVLLTVEIPSLLGRKYNLNAQQTGLQFVGALVGALLGEPIAGYGSDKFMQWRTRRANGQREPEMRLPIALPGFLLVTIGLIVFGVQLQNTQAGVWSVTPVVGCAIAAFGLQLVTTVVYTYTVESQPVDLMPRVPLFVALTRQVYAYAFPLPTAILFIQY
ncbi:MFS general substrate transporter [Meredithblackwellia eburnea MCA 4105]